jgi:DNA-binding NarL/FixJ family response regulator
MITTEDVMSRLPQSLSEFGRGRLHERLGSICREILQRLAEGQERKAIAQDMDLGLSTMDGHMARIREILSVHSGECSADYARLTHWAHALKLCDLNQPAK